MINRNIFIPKCFNPFLFAIATPRVEANDPPGGRDSQVENLGDNKEEISKLMHPNSKLKKKFSKCLDN